MAELDKVRLGGRNFIRPGDTVKVKPSRPGKRDGFRARVAAIFDGDPVTVEVRGLTSGRARDAVRTVELARLERVAQTRADG